jgi:hypothetical protein
LAESLLKDDFFLYEYYNMIHYILLITIYYLLYEYNIEKLTISDFYNNHCSSLNIDKECINNLDMCADKDTNNSDCDVCVTNFLQYVCTDHNIVSNYCNIKKQCDDILSVCNNDCTNDCLKNNINTISSVCTDQTYVNNYFANNCKFT